jgi:hypothetical protein
MNYYDRLSLHRLFTGLTNAIMTVVEVLLALRFIFRLFAANSSAPFVNWLYDTTAILISPFRGIFTSPVVNGQFVFDITTLISIVIYGLLFSFIIYLFDLTFNVTRD